MIKKPELAGNPAHFGLIISENDGSLTEDILCVRIEQVLFCHHNAEKSSSVVMPMISICVKNILIGHKMFEQNKKFLTATCISGKY
ncbi:hypothetical protein TNIN_440031 [Trichonephila inaurata madagascariensis]|uniref:Uncharacterized protein n=1 Tax=Trichonephila inaurata madagascariensis TaxID=2747483 RepID=A0A8X6X3D7_9ARAC|nr:hypothetical protein TNIN_440031 [Trichonephila inaurata madagascariensis]